MEQSHSLIKWQSSKSFSIVDICMPVYNPNLDWLYESLQSISLQVFIDWRLILVLDSMPMSRKFGIYDLLDLFNFGNRLLVLENKVRGLVNCLNLGLSYVSAPYFARMDYDDRMLPQRLSKQINLLESNSLLVGCGSQVVYLSQTDKQVFTYHNRHPTSYIGFLFFGAFVNNPIAHPSLVIRSEILKNLSGYFNIVSMEDYDLISRCLDYGIFFNMSEALLEYRVHSSQHSKQVSALRKDLFIVRLRFYRKLCKINFIWTIFFPILLFWFLVGPRFEKRFRNSLLYFIRCI